MRFLLLTALLLAPTAALAQATQLTIPSCFKQAAPLAKRLGVRPTDTAALVIQGCDGKNYDVLAMMNAVLDRMEQASRKGAAK